MATPWEEYARQIRLEQTLTALRPDIAPGLARYVVGQAGAPMIEQMAGPGLQPNPQHLFDTYLMQQALAAYQADQQAQQAMARQREEAAVRDRIAREQAQAMAAQLGGSIAAAQAAAQAAAPSPQPTPVAAPTPEPVPTATPTPTTEQPVPGQPPPVRGEPFTLTPEMVPEGMPLLRSPEEIEAEVAEAGARVDDAWARAQEREAAQVYEAILAKKLEDAGGVQAVQLQREELNRDVTLARQELAQLQGDMAEGMEADTYWVNVLVPNRIPTRIGPDGQEVIDEDAWRQIPEHEMHWEPVELTAEEYAAYLEEKIEFDEGLVNLNQQVIDVGFGVTSEIGLTDLVTQAAIGTMSSLGKIQDAGRSIFGRRIGGTLLYAWARTPLAQVDEEILQAFGGEEQYANWREGIVQAYEEEGAVAVWEGYMAKLPDAAKQIPLVGPGVAMLGHVLLDLSFDPLTYFTLGSSVLANAAIRSATAGQARRAAMLKMAADTVETVDAVTAIPGLVAWDVLQRGGRLIQRGLPGANEIGPMTRLRMQRQQAQEGARAFTRVSDALPDAYEARRAEQLDAVMRGIDESDPVQRRGLIDRVLTPEERLERIDVYAVNQPVRGRTLNAPQRIAIGQRLKNPPPLESGEIEVVNRIIQTPDGGQAGLRVVYNEQTGQITARKLEFMGGRRAGKKVRTGAKPEDWRWSRPVTFQVEDAIDFEDVRRLAPERLDLQSRQMARNQAEVAVQRAPQGTRVDASMANQMDVGRRIGPDVEIIAADPRKSVRALYNERTGEVRIEVYRGKNDGGWTRAGQIRQGDYLSPEQVVEPDYHPIFEGARQKENSFVRTLPRATRVQVYRMLQQRLADIWPRMHADRVQDSLDEQRIWEMQWAADIIETTRRVVGPAGDLPKWRLIHQGVSEESNIPLIERRVFTGGFEGDRAVLAKRSLVGSRDIPTISEELNKLKKTNLPVPSTTGGRNNLDPDDWYDWAMDTSVLRTLDRVSPVNKPFTSMTKGQQQWNRLRNRWLLDNAQIRVAEAYKGAPLESWEKAELLDGNQLKVVRDNLLREPDPQEVQRELLPPLGDTTPPPPRTGVIQDVNRARFEEIETIPLRDQPEGHSYEIDEAGVERLDGLTREEYDDKFGLGEFDRDIGPAREELYDPYYEDLLSGPDIRPQTTPFPPEVTAPPRQRGTSPTLENADEYRGSAPVAPTETEAERLYQERLRTEGITPGEPEEIGRTIRQYGATPPDAVVETLDPRIERLTQAVPRQVQRLRSPRASVGDFTPSRQNIKYARNWTIPDALFYRGALSDEEQRFLNQVVETDDFGNRLTAWDVLEDVQQRGGDEKEMIGALYRRLGLDEEATPKLYSKLWQISKALIRDNVMYTYFRGLMPISLDAFTDAAHAFADGQSELAASFLRNHVEVVKRLFSRENIGFGEEKARAAQELIVRPLRESIQSFEVITGQRIPPNFSHGALAKMQSAGETLVDEERIAATDLYSTQAERLAGRLGQRARSIASVGLSSGRLKAGRTVQDDSRRVLSYQNHYRIQHEYALAEFESYLAEMAPRMGLEPEDAIARLREIEPQSFIDEPIAASQFRQLMPGFTPLQAQDITNAFGDGGHANALARRWRNLQKQAGKIAEKETERLLFSYKMTKLDEQIGQFVFFHYWMSRAVKLQAELYFNNPIIQANFYRMYEGMDRAAEDDPSIPSYLRHAFSILAGPYGMVGMMTPEGFLAPIALGMELSGINTRDDRTLYDRTIGAVAFVNPIVTAALSAVGVSDEIPDPTATYAMRAKVRFAINAMKALGVGEMEPTDDIVTNTMQTIINMARSKGLTLDQTPINTPERDDYDNRRLAHYLAQEMELNGIDPASAEADPIWIDFSTGARQSEYFQNAFQKWVVDQTVMEGARLFLPLQSTFHPENETNYLAREVTALRDAGDYDAITPEMETAEYVRSLGNAASPESSMLRIGLQARDRIGSPEMQETYEHYNDMVYESAEVIQQRWGPLPVVHIGPEEQYPLEQWVLFDENEKRLLLDRWLHNTNQYREYEQFINERGEFTDTNPLVAGYSDFAGQMREDENGAFLQQLLSDSPAFRDWYAQQSTDNPETLLRSPDAYLAASGHRPSIYDRIDDRATDLDQLSIMDLQGGFGQGAGQEYFAKSFDEMTPEERVTHIYEELRSFTNKEQKFFEAVEGVAPGAAERWYDLIPSAKSYILNLLEPMGVREPQRPAILTAFLKWSIQQPPGRDDPRHFVMWYQARERQMYGEGAPNLATDYVIPPELVSHGDRLSALD